ncbi:phage integrase N-terminal SAM-like domain-containing protein [Peribacillus simplex]|uniref:phage integrase N-terminal SAM-like domain-containing protein n=1 Tax=Peribacillus simplex TaxID=1478 RepID=UPI0011A8D748|nr:phage integrase N-terminal SAM-like domain-containing protein [Peribacillus simplex]
MKRTRFLTKDEQQKLNSVDKKVHYVTDWTSAMEMFLKDCEIRGLRESTSFYYVKETRMIFRHWEEQELDISPDQLTSEHITDLILYMKNKKELSPSSINIRLRAFKTVLKWLYDNKKVPINAGDGVKRRNCSMRMR